MQGKFADAVSLEGGNGSATVKVATVSTSFWAIKLLTTGMGETTSDYLAHTFDPAIVVPIVGLLTVSALVLQLTAKRYFDWLYWLVVVMVSVFGTMIADVLHIGFGVPYVVSTPVFAAALATIFALWRTSERTLSIHSITTRRRELFYWATVVATFALGTAAGDMTATTFRLGYFASGVLFAALFAVPALAYWGLRLNPTVAFWTAYVITRPVGASFADWFGVSPTRGGLDLGTGATSLVLALVIAALVACRGRPKV
ncbi:MAG: hypothetical protein ABI216_08745 [Devosia sp.]